MRHVLILLSIILIGIYNSRAMPLTAEGKLEKCSIDTNCVLVEWKLDDINKAFKELSNIASSLPRTTVLENTDTYWHGVVRSLIFRFPDDLEMLKITSKNIVQVRSASRFGVSDLGVNKNRVDKIYQSLLNIG